MTGDGTPQQSHLQIRVCVCVSVGLEVTRRHNIHSSPLRLAMSTVMRRHDDGFWRILRTTTTTTARLFEPMFTHTQPHTHMSHHRSSHSNVIANSRLHRRRIDGNITYINTQRCPCRTFHPARRLYSLRTSRATLSTTTICGGISQQSDPPRQQPTRVYTLY